MKPEALKASLAALEALMQDELASASPARYVRVTRLCDMAHRLVQMGATRVKEVTADPGIGGIYNGVGDVGLGQPIGGGGIVTYNPVTYNPDDNEVANVPQQMGLGRHVGAQQADLVDLLREMVMAAQKPSVLPPMPMIDPVFECRTLLELRDDLIKAGRDPQVIDKRLDAALAALERKPDDSADLVPSLVLRGHPPGDDSADQQEREADVSADRGEAYDRGEGGARPVGQNGAQEGVAR